MTRAETLAKHLGDAASYDKAPWLYRRRSVHFCSACKHTTSSPSTFRGKNAICPNCSSVYEKHTRIYLSTPDPLSDHTDALVWLGALVGWSCFNQLQVYWKDDGRHYQACDAPNCEFYDALSPVQAIIAAMRAADPALDAAMERADGTTTETREIVK
jgi:hypothetical protein